MRKLFSGFVLEALVLAMALIQPVSGADSVNFPMGVTQLQSPDRRFVIKNFDCSAPKGNLPKYKYVDGKTIDGHYLEFYDTVSKRQILIRTYLRNVDVFWSPDSSAFAVTDWAASDFSEAYLYSTSDVAHPINIGRRLIESSKKSVADTFDIAHCSHRYIFIKKWSNPECLIVGITGHPETNFSITYAWDLKKKFVKIGRLSEENADREISN